MRHRSIALAPAVCGAMFVSTMVASGLQEDRGYRVDDHNRLRSVADVQTSPDGSKVAGSTG